jgi:putative ABC transport system permease protein
MTRSDVVFALRRLRSSPAVVIGIVAMLVVGIGLATTMFALSDPFLGRSLPYAQPDRLVLIDVEIPLMRRDFNALPPDFPTLADWRARTDLFDGLAALHRHGSLRVRLPSRVVALETIAVSPDVFSVLGIPAPASVTSAAGDEIWLTRRALAGPLAGAELEDAILSLSPSGSAQVRGVLPGSFLVPLATERAPVDALIDMAPDRIASTVGGVTTRLTVVGRLRLGVEPEQVQAALSADAAQRRFSVRVTPLATAMKASQRPLAIGALLSGMLVLLVCATNTFGMSLTRGLYRGHQMATVAALGASRLSIARLLLIEGVCVATAGTIGAFVVVPLLSNAIVAVVPRNYIVLGEPGLSARVAAFAGLSGLIACGAWWGGSLVAWARASRAGLRAAILRDGPIVRAIRFTLLGGQVAVTIVLLAGAALLGRSQLNLARVDTGLADETLALSAAYEPHVAGARLRETIDRTTAELRQLVGVRRAAAVVGEMIDGSNVNATVIVGRPVSVEFLWVSSGYFEAAGMSFIRGRSLQESDTGGRGLVVNEAFVNRYLGGRVEVGDPVLASGVPTPIVGIVRDSRRRALDEDAQPALFRPLDDAMPPWRVTYLVSGQGLPAASLESVVRKISPDAVILDGSTLAARLLRTVQDRSFATLVVGLFAGATVAVTLAAIISAVGYGVARRTREIAIRLALGATPRHVAWLTIRDAVAATVAGAATGLIAVSWLSGAISSLLYGLSATDSTTLAVAAITMVGLAAGVAAATARRAGRLSPRLALQQE